MDGILAVYKPVGITSFDVIRELKHAIHPDFKVGHGGTLDPFADGVLLLLLGKATKRMNELAELPKTYLATAVLGARSDTLDRTGIIVPQIINHAQPECNEGAGKFSNSQIEEAAKKFVGEIEQVIPDYSATKIKGVPRYKLARRGEAMEKKTKMVMIYDLRFVLIEDNKVEFEATVSSGTYIRQLSYDIFKSLGVESYLEALTRTRIGDFSLMKCCEMSDFNDDIWKNKVT